MTAPPPPDEAGLHEAALRHLARYATTRAGLARVLNRRIDRWAREAEGEPEAIAAAAAAARAAAAAVVARLAAAGAVDDAAFAAARARSLARAGRSRRAVAAHLAARGVAAAEMREALGEADAEAEFAAALIFARRRRLGPFRAGGADAETARRELAAFARAGFPQSLARRALGMDPESAEALVLRLRRE
jgi:regulatory protein